MWDLKSDVSQNTLSNPLTPFKPRRVGQYHLPLFKIARQTSQAIMVSLSWNASKVSVVAENESFLKHAFSVFSFDKSLQSPARGKSSSTFNSLTPYDASRLDPKLKTFYGYGRFHMIDVSNPNIEDQLFVTCDKNSVNIYSAHEQWSHLRSIIDGAMAWNPSATMDTVRAKYVSWNSEQGVVYVGDLITGLIVTRRQYSKSTVSRFSRDGSQMIMHHTGFEVSTYWTESGTHINTTDCCLGFPAYFQDESRLILSSVVWDEAFGRGEQGAILDATNMFTVDRIAISTQNYEQQLQSYGPEARKIIALHGSKLSLYRIEDVTIKPYSQPRHSCNDSCFDELTTLSSIDAQAISEGENTQFVASSGLRFRVELRAASTSGWRCGSDLLQSLVIWVTNSEGKSREALIIPPSDLGNILGIWLENRITFNATTQQVIIRSHILLMMWVLPTTFEGDFMLLNAAWTQLCRFQIEDKNDWLWTILSQCTHGQTYLKLQTMDDNNEDVIVDIMNLYCENVFMEAPNHSLEGALALIEIFEISDNVFKRAILQYIGRYINCYSNPKDLSENIVARICQNVTHENQNNYNRFLTALFESPYGRWVPRRDYNERTNPISILLKLTEKVPMAIEVAHTIINYCTRQANLKKDPQFAEILLKPLHDLLDRTQLHTDISLGALRRLAFIPVRGRTFILDHHKIAHPPSWWKFWSKNEPIYKCENPVWQLDRRPLSKPTNLLNDNFTRDIFVASFDMLWRAPKEVVDTRSTVARIKSSTHTPQSWLRTLFNVVLLKCKLAPKSDVELHGFELESYGNPAIVALIEFKW
ncbi:hypothetical protein BGZ46_004135 [Entomortierella lignicola]|nr:hypothetical protein BGZ46_004135 [Entomortierella lignicola]